MGKRAKGRRYLMEEKRAKSPEHLGASHSPSTYGAKRTLSFADTP